MKRRDIIRSILFIIIGTIILIIGKRLYEYLNYVVGSVLLFYSLEYYIEEISLKENLFQRKSLKAIFELILGIFIIFGNLEKSTICIIWALWAILREDEEIEESIQLFKKGVPAVINLAESIVVIVLSFMLIKNPIEHEATIHIYLLGVEIILEAIFPVVDDLLLELVEKRRNKNKDNEVIE